MAITVALQKLLGSINNDLDYFEGIKDGDPESIQTVFSTLLETYDPNVVASLLLTDDFITLLGRQYNTFIQQKMSEEHILNISMNNLKFKTQDAIDFLRTQNRYLSRDTSRDLNNRSQSRETNRWKTPNVSNSSGPPSHYPPSSRPSAGYWNPVPRTQDNRSRTPTTPSFNSGQSPSQLRDGRPPSNGFNRSHSREQPRPRSPRSGDRSLPGKQAGWSPSRPTSATRPYEELQSSLPLPPEDTSSSQFFPPIPSYVDSPSPFKDSQSISSGYSSLKDIDQASESSSRSNKTLSFKKKLQKFVSRGHSSLLPNKKLYDASINSTNWDQGSVAARDEFATTLDDLLPPKFPNKTLKISPGVSPDEVNLTPSVSGKKASINDISNKNPNLILKDDWIATELNKGKKTIIVDTSVPDILWSTQDISLDHIPDEHRPKF